MTNRFKKIITIAFVFLFSFIIVSCDKPEEGGNNEPTFTGPKLIGLDISGFKSEYDVNEDLDLTGLKVMAIYDDSTSKEVQPSVDTSNFDKTKDNTYEIIISYTENNITAKSFFFAIVGTGIQEDDNQGGLIDKIFGPGTYIFDGTDDLIDYMANQGLAANTQFADGYFTVKGLNAKRANSETLYAIELPKAEGAWIEFEVNGTAKVTIECSSTGKENTSVIGLYDSESSLVNNNEGVTDVYSTTVTTITYNLLGGYYRLVSPAGMTNSERGVRVYSITVVQE